MEYTLYTACRTDFYAPYPGEKSVPDFVQFLNDASTLFMNDVNGLYLEREK
jgi:mannan endo-1,4-beta-mannosidase